VSEVQTVQSLNYLSWPCPMMISLTLSQILRVILQRARFSLIEICTIVKSIHQSMCFLPYHVSWRVLLVLMIMVRSSLVRIIQPCLTNFTTSTLLVRTPWPWKPSSVRTLLQLMTRTTYSSSKSSRTSSYSRASMRSVTFSDLSRELGTFLDVSRRRRSPRSEIKTYSKSTTTEREPFKDKARMARSSNESHLKVSIFLIT